MLRRTFEKMVGEALDSLPADFQARLANVEVVVEDWPNRAEIRQRGGGTLFGLYQGIPLTERGNYYNLVLPDKITIFQGPIEEYARSPEEIKKLVQRVVIHEIAHHFGISDERLKELGWG
jgi:predicted Zn-dependent protease with MMP-like domain